jgi:hypothetical protein
MGNTPRRQASAPGWGRLGACESPGPDRTAHGTSRAPGAGPRRARTGGPRRAGGPPDPRPPPREREGAGTRPPLRAGRTRPGPPPARPPPAPTDPPDCPVADGHPLPAAAPGVRAPPQSVLGPRLRRRRLGAPHGGADHTLHRRARRGTGSERPSMSNRRPSEPTAFQAVGVQSPPQGWVETPRLHAIATRAEVGRTHPPTSQESDPKCQPGSPGWTL